MDDVDADDGEADPEDVCSFLYLSFLVLNSPVSMPSMCTCAHFTEPNAVAR